MKFSNNDELNRLLTEVFGNAGEVPDPHEDREPQRDESDELEAALKGGPAGLHEFLERRNQANGKPVMQVEVVDNGVVLTLGEIVIQLDPIETIDLQAQLATIIRRQMERHAILQILKKLMGQDGN